MLKYFLTEKWLSGRKRVPAKDVSGLNWTGGSNPLFSAEHKNPKRQLWVFPCSGRRREDSKRAQPCFFSAWLRPRKNGKRRAREFLTNDERSEEVKPKATALGFSVLRPEKRGFEKSGLFKSPLWF